MACLGDEEKKLAGLCRRCGGKCCRGHHILLSKAEYASLKGIKEFAEGRIDSPSGCTIHSIDALSGGKCPFLGVEGCELSVKDRPLVCRMFPVTFTLEKDGLRFHLTSFCPYVEELKGLSIWLAEIKKQAEKELNRNWSGREIRCYGRFMRKKDDDFVDF